MSTIISVIPEIKSLYFLPFPNKPTAGIRVARVYDTLVGVSTTGTVYTNRVSDKAFYVTDPRRFDEVWAGLVKLKVLSAEAIKAHALDREQRQQERIAKQAAECILRNVGEAGIKLTKAQFAKLKRLSPDKR